MATGPWSVKGIDPRAREVAKAAAQREGLTLGEWMNKRLLNDTTPQAHTQHNPQSLLSTAAQAHENARYGDPAALSIHSSGSNTNHPDVNRAIEDLTRRLEAAERRSTLAITGIDQSVLGMLTRLEGVEKVHNDVTSKIETSLDLLETMATKSRDEIDRTVSKVDRSTEDSARRIDTVAEHTDLQLGRARHELSKELELVNTRSDELSQRLSAAERQTDNAVRALEANFASVDERLRHSEKQLSENSSDGLSDMFNQRFKTLSDELIHVVAQTRGQLAAQIEAQAASPRLDQFENSLRDVRGHLADSERRHADTLERIAGEVGKLGSAIEHRFAEVERNTATSLDKMLDSRFREFQNDHANAIDKIGDGLTGAITRLEDKFATLEEKRSAEDNLEARIIASEERTAKMVEEALARIQDKLDTQHAQDQDENSPVQKAMLALAARLEALEHTNTAPPFDPSANIDDQHGDGTPAPLHSAENTDHNPAMEEIIRPPQNFDDGLHPSLPPLSMDPDDGMGGGFEDTYLDDNTDGTMPPEAIIAPMYAPAHDEGHYNTAAGATADASFMAAARRSMRASATPAAGDAPQQARRKGGSRKFLMAASFVAIIAIAGAGTMTFMDFGKDTKGPKAGPVNAASTNWDDLIDGAQTVPQDQNAAAPEGNTAFTALDGAEPAAQDNTSPESSASNTAPKPQATNTPARQPVRTATSQTRPAPRPQTTPPAVTARRTQDSINIAAAPQPKPTIPVASAPLAQPGTAKSTTGRQSIQQAAQSGDPIAQFQLASAKLDAGDTQAGVVLMKQAAERGLPIAQYRLGKLYEEGTGVTKDEREGRRWTTRAANGGNRRAMHNLAMMFAEGNGVPQNYETAAKWFQEAARMGLTNSQYNLAFLYEQGLGVPESLAQAFAWYSIAAKAGDGGAKDRATEIGATLAPAAKSEAKTIIASFRPRPLDLAANGIFRNVSWARPQLNTAPNIARAQVLLARLGYQPGPADGNPGSSTRKAIIAYERDQGLAQTGRIDAALLAKLESSAIN